jgi:hypothetical protein
LVDKMISARQPHVTLGEIMGYIHAGRSVHQGRVPPSKYRSFGRAGDTCVYVH